MRKIFHCFTRPVTWEFIDLQIECIYWNNKKINIFDFVLKWQLWNHWNVLWKEKMIFCERNMFDLISILKMIDMIWIRFNFHSYEWYIYILYIKSDFMQFTEHSNIFLLLSISQAQMQCKNLFWIIVVNHKFFFPSCVTLTSF